MGPGQEMELSSPDFQIWAHFSSEQPESEGCYKICDSHDETCVFVIFVKILLSECRELLRFIQIQMQY